MALLKGHWSEGILQRVLVNGHCLKGNVQRILLVKVHFCSLFFTVCKSWTLYGHFFPSIINARENEKETELELEVFKRIIA